MNKKIIICSVLLFLFTTGVSYFGFSFAGVTPISGANLLSPMSLLKNGTKLDIDPTAPKTEACPLNGAMYTKVEKEAWEKRRPLAIMVENSTEARPHSGINRADIVYEAVAEGGVTRFMPVYYCDAQSSNVYVAPVRSVRTYFLNYASEYGETPLFGHVGGANCSADKLPNGNYGPCKTDKRVQAIEQLSDYGWRYSKGNDLDQFSVGAKAYVRNESRLKDIIGRDVATEHSVVGSTEQLWKEGEVRGWTNLDPKGVEWTKSFKPWKFQDDATTDQRGSVATVSYDFWEGYKEYDARWEYDITTNTYKRFSGGEPHKDLETGQQLDTKNIVVILAKEIGPVDPLKHMYYETTGEGKALFFQNGQVIEGFWKKAKRLNRTVFTNKKGEEIQFVRGRIWLSLVDDSTKVSY